MCVEPNDAERHSLHESDDEILAVKVEGKKLLNIKWNVTSLFFKNIEHSTTLILPNPDDPEKDGPFCDNKTLDQNKPSQVSSFIM